MPLQIWTPVSPHADYSALAAGIADAGRSIGSGLTGMAADMKRKQEADQQRAEQAKKIRGMAKMFSDDLGLSKSEIETKDANELAGMVEVFMNENSPRHQKLKAEHEQLAIAALKRQAENETAQRRVPGVMMEQVEGAAAGVPSPLNNEAFDQRLTQDTGLPPFVRNFIAAHAKAGAPLPPSAIDDLLRQSAGGEGVNWEAIKPREFTTSGGRRGVYGKGGQFQFEQQDLNPDGSTERTLSDGTVQSWNGSRWINAPRARGVSPEFTAQLGKQASGLDDPKYGPAIRKGLKAMIDSAHTLKQLDDEQRDALYGQFGIGEGSGAGTPEAPKNPKERTAGKSYSTPKGVLKWTGTGWMKP